MSDWLVHLVQIGKFGKHPNADSLSITQIYGQNVIFRTGTYQEGDLAVFLPPDSVLPSNPEHPLLKDNPHLKPGHRVDAVRLRGIFSNGFTVPAHVLFTPEELKDIPIGTHVAERIGVTKYVDQGDALSTGGENERDPGFLPCYTDIEGWAKYRNQGILNPGDDVIITEKIHGCVDANTILETLENGPMSIQEIVSRQLPVHVKSTNLSIVSPSMVGTLFDDTMINFSSETTPVAEYKLVLDWSELPSIDNWFEIELSNGKTLKITGNHEVWLPKLRCWRRVDELTTEDEFLVD
jgi:hypothetical protein